MLLSSGILAIPVASAASSSPSFKHRTLTSPHPEYGGDFGYSVAVSGDVAVVGAPLESSGGYDFNGHAYIFNAKTGALISSLTSPNPQNNGWFGESVAVSGSTVIVGAPDEGANGYSYAGHAYTFDAKTGDLVSTLVSPNAQADGFFGYSVAASGKIAVVGAYNEGADGYAGAGNAYSFNAVTGDLIDTLTSPNAQSGGWFGFSVAVDASTIVVGAAGEIANGNSQAGNAYTFDAKTGALISTLTSPNAQTDGVFGNSVAVNGEVVAVGAPQETSNGDQLAGNAYTFDAATGALTNTLTSPNAQYYGFFGNSVATNGSIVIVGAPKEASSGVFQAGNAYTFSGTTGALISTLVSPGPHHQGFFGSSVSANGKIIIIGAFYEPAEGTKNAGHAYIF